MAARDAGEEKGLVVNGHHFEIKKGNDDKFYVGFQTRPGHVFYFSSGFDSHERAEHLVSMIKVYGPNAPLHDVARVGGVERPISTVL